MFKNQTYFFRKGDWWLGWIRRRGWIEKGNPRVLAKGEREGKGRNGGGHWWQCNTGDWWIGLIISLCITVTDKNCHWIGASTPTNETNKHPLSSANNNNNNNNIMWQLLKPWINNLWPYSIFLSLNLGNKLKIINYRIMGESMACTWQKFCFHCIISTSYYGRGCLWSVGWCWIFCH